MKKDYILVGSLIFISVLLLILFNVGKEKADYAYVYIEDKLEYKIDLSINKEYEILDGKMTLIVKDKKIGVKDSKCHDHTCEHMGMTNSSAKSIICAYYKVVIKLSNDSDVDIII